MGLLFAAVFSIVCQAQPGGGGFSQDQRIDQAKNVLKDYYKNPDYKFVTDHAGTNLSQGFLFRDIDLSPYELFVANFSFSEKDQVQKINFQPLKLFKPGSSDIMQFLGNLKLNIVQRKDITTFGAGVGMDNSSPFSKRSGKLLKNIFDVLAVPEPPTLFDPSNFTKQKEELRISYDNGKIDKTTYDLLNDLVDNSMADAKAKAEADYSKKLDNFKKTALDAALLKFDLARVKHVFKWTIGANTQLFSVLGAKGRTNSFDSLNYYSGKATVFSASASYSNRGGWISLSAAYNSSDSRKSAAKFVDKVHYNGYSFSVSKRVFKFLDDAKLMKHPAYIKSQFIPSVNAGISWDLKDTKDGRFNLIEEGIVRSRVVSPYLDILITPATQFRISMPFQKNSLVDGTKRIFLGANVQYGIKFSNLN